MSKAAKVLANWRNNRPREVNRRDVEKILDEYFPNQWRLEGGSHIVVTSIVLKKYKKYQPYGEITIPLKSGRKVKWFYIKDILQALDFIKHDEEASDE